VNATELQKCPSCRERKPKRSCPALGTTICTVCCATKRQVEIACPADCVYLTSAKSHPPAVVQRRQERDVGFVLPLISDLSETQYRLLVVFQSVTVQHAAGAMPPLLDLDVAEGAAAAAATLETAGKGIIYEHQAVAVPAQRLTSELARVIGEFAAKAGSQRGRFERDAAVALRRLEQGARTAAKALAGDEPPVYLRLLGRMLQAAAAGAGSASQDDVVGAPPPGSSGLIVTP
jgi:hypothetical protein